ncbi:MAG: YciI family protein [Gemmatimonas sp.]|nr:YciI family protein [Gemmatimonas sp.]
MKYLCFAYDDEQAFNDMPLDDWQALRQEVMDYAEQLKNERILIATHALQGIATAATVRVRNDEVSVVDGPFAESKEHIGGYFLIEAGSFEEAVQIASKWPSARIGTIEVRPVEEQLAMDSRYG